MRERFRKFSHQTSALMGSPWAFIVALILIISWAASGPLFHFSDTWQLVINTSTTIITFLMVFLIQNTQNRDAQAIQLKLDELLRAGQEARTSMVDLEHLSDGELEQMQAEFRRLGGKFTPLVADDLHADDQARQGRQAKPKAAGANHPGGARQDSLQLEIPWAR